MGRLIAAVGLAGWAVALFTLLYTRETSQPGPALEATTARALVLYAYHETPAGKKNLEFFLRHGLLHRSEAQYVFICNGAHTIDFPKLSHVTVLTRENTCFDFGAWDVGLRSVDTNQFKYFVFINASVRGPFLPAWARWLTWLEVFTRLITTEIKLVGTTGNCLTNGHPIPPAPGTVRLYHLQSMFLVTDAAGLPVIRPFLKCYKSMGDAALLGELQLTRAFSNAGFATRSLLLHDDAVIGFPEEGCDHQNVWGGPGQYYGLPAPHPLELIFYKYKEGETAYSVGQYVEKYTEWLDLS
jgi:hypothetical protein